MFDMSLSGLALIILSPVILLTWILVLIKLGSPAIFCQYRPGKNNKLFKLRKFRSMTNETDENGNLLPDYRRLTNFGKFLRTSNLDELPQLWNIFIGEMSFIGPRPKLLKDIIFFDDEQNRRSKVRPGITGLAQINGRNEACWDDVIKYDIEYVNTKNKFKLDVKIFFKTVSLLIKRNRTEECGSANHEFYYYGDYLLNTNKVSAMEYTEKNKMAKQILSKYEKVYTQKVNYVQEELEDLNEKFQ